MLGCAGPSWLTREGIVVSFHAEPGLVRLAETVAAQHPELGAYPRRSTAATPRWPTRCAWASRADARRPDAAGDLPHWHQVGDTFDKMDPEVLGRAYAFTTAFVARWTPARPIRKSPSAI